MLITKQKDPESVLQSQLHFISMCDIAACAGVRLLFQASAGVTGHGSPGMLAMRPTSILWSKAEGKGSKGARFANCFSSRNPWEFGRYRCASQLLHCRGITKSLKQGVDGLVSNVVGPL